MLTRVAFIVNYTCNLGTIIEFKLISLICYVKIMSFVLFIENINTFSDLIIILLGSVVTNL